MSRLLTLLTVPCAAVALLVLTAAAPAADNPAASSSDRGGKTAESPTADSGNGAAGPAPKSSSGSATSGTADAQQRDALRQTDKQEHLQLTDEQRQQIRTALAKEKTDVTFEEAGIKPFKDFEPAVGKTIPAQLPLQEMPRELSQAMPAIRNYTYMKTKGQVLIIDSMSKKIVDMFPAS